MIRAFLLMQILFSSQMVEQYHDNAFAARMKRHHDSSYAPADIIMLQKVNREGFTIDEHGNMTATDQLGTFSVVLADSVLDRRLKAVLKQYILSYIQK